MKAEINWMKGWANPPKLVVHAELADDSNFVYEERQGCYFASDRKSGQVRFFHYAKAGSGYGGRKFLLPMKDGTLKEIIGPWSSRCSVMNAVDFPHSVEVNFMTEDGLTSGAMLIDKARDYLASTFEDAIFRQCLLGGFEINYEIVSL
jgi:hypothetical protein